ncbi:hypothetical protein F5Y08DRAFT_301989 [Xylaria arbuscula]|nr:hypothetical protein F5Y08DRAFT_301989 [Xylaria arbuscula]
MSSSTGDAPTQRVPAWKRLGLKLKPASEGQSHDATHPPSTNGTSSVPNNRAHLGGSSTPNAKRRASGGAPALDHSAKRARQDDWQDQTSSSHQTPPTTKKPKAVSFAADTAGPQPPVPVKTKQSKPKQKGAGGGAVNAALATVPAKPIKKTAPVNLEPALAYLRTWHTARDSWKFNKNHQTRLLEQVFAGADETTIPAVDINVFYEYIRGLQGGVRTRLRELANGIKAQDMQEGAAGFPAMAANKEMAERKQKEYEEVIKMFLNQPRSPEKRRFDEVEYVLRTTDMEMQRRVVKRMRAEMVVDELSETESEATTATSTATNTTTSGDSTTTEKGMPSGSGGDSERQRLQLNDGPQQRTKRKRKLRTAAVEDDTSSESESESESEDDTSSSSSSSSGSSSDSDSKPEAGNGDDDETSSSSSSSSESSDSEDDD